MKKVIPFALCLLYIVTVFAVGGLGMPALSFWLVAGLSLAFLWLYSLLSPRLLSVPVAVVFLATVLLPVLFLFLIGLPVYHSWPSTATSIFSAFRDHGQFWGLELFVPFFVAVIGALVMHRRSNIASERDARKSGARPST